MVGFSGNRMRKLLVVVAVSLVVFVIHQLSYAENFALAGQLSESIRIVNKCTFDALEPLDTFHPITDSKIPNIVHQLWKTTNIQEYSTEMKASHESWKTMLEPQNYTVKLWTDDDDILTTSNEPTSPDCLSSAERIQCLKQLGLQAIFSPTSGTLGLSNHFFMAERGSPLLEWVLYEAKLSGSHVT
ncbi:unnamed protein product [Penicillium viridicatum]